MNNTTTGRTTSGSTIMKHRKCVLIAQTDIHSEQRFTELLEQWFERTDSVNEIESLLGGIGSNRYDLLIVDDNLWEAHGDEISEAVNSLDDPPMMLMSHSDAKIQTVVEACRKGVIGVISKQIEADDLMKNVSEILDIHFCHLENEVEFFEKTITVRTQSRAMNRTYQEAYWAATSDANVLITGETGTGKEVMARIIHQLSKRSEGPFISINCGAIPSELLESEMFGHIEGAFSGAYRSRKGRFELADGGTVFLDEIGDMPIEHQVKLLRFLQNKEITPVGGTTSKRIDCRIICASNADLKKSIENEMFREDLFFRINVVPLTVAPLRERREDIMILADNFLKHINHNRKMDITGFSDEVKKIILNYEWPGNVRELENTIDRAILMKQSGMIESADLPKKMREWATASGAIVVKTHIQPTDYDYDDVLEPVNLSDFTSSFEGSLIIEALKKADLKKKRAADYLGMNRTTLLEKIKKLSKVTSYLNRQMIN